MFQLNENGPAVEEVEEESNVAAATQWLLPNSEQLVYNTHALIIHSQLIIPSTSSIE